MGANSAPGVLQRAQAYLKERAQAGVELHVGGRVAFSWPGLITSDAALRLVCALAGMGSAMGAFLHAVAPASSADHFSRCRPSTSSMFKCRKRRAASSKKTNREVWFNEDIWICVMSLLDAKSLLRLAVTNRQFCGLAKDDLIWKSVFLRDIPALSIDMRPAFSWMSLYLAACDGSHSYSHHDSEKHIDWMRIGVFCMESGEAVATDRLMDMKLICESKNTSQSDSLLLQTYLIPNVKKGFWIADLHLVHCPVCNLASCEGTMQALDVRHWELFLNKQYKTGEWKFEQVHTRHVTGHCGEAAACIFDANQLRSKGTKDVLDLSKWIAAPGNWLPRGRTSPHGAAACTNLHANKGLRMKFHTMKAGTGGPVVGIRFCQELA